MAHRHDDENTGKEDVTSDTDSKDRPIGRRSFIKYTGTAAAATSITATGASAATTHRGISFDRVVDAVEDLGLDPDGNEDVSGRLDSVSPGTLVEFPNGTYKINGIASWGSGNVGLLGVGEDVTFDVAGPYNDWILTFGGNEFLVENIDIDLNGDETNAGIRCIASNGFHFQDIEWLGRGGLYYDGSPQGNVRNMFNLGVRNGDGVGVLRNVVAKRIGVIGDAYGGGGRRRVGAWGSSSHKGTIRFENCDFRESGNNGLYMSRNEGVIQVEDSYFENCNISCVRISTEGSYVRNTHFVIDADRLDGPVGNPDESTNLGGFIQEHYGESTMPGPVVVEGCTFEGLSLGYGVPTWGAICRWPSGRRVVVRDCHIRWDIDDEPAVYARSVGSRNSSPPKWIHADGLTITGDASGSCAISLNHAPDSHFQNCCIHQTGSDRNGFELSDADGSVIEDSAIDVSGEAVQVNGSDVTTRNVSNDASCGSDGNDASTEDATDSTLPNRLTIDGDQGKANYEFTVDGDLEKSEEGDATIDDHDAIDGSTATGHVWGNRDSYRFSGEITDFYLDAAATVYLNGEQVDPTTLGSDLSHTLVIDGEGSDERTPYEFAVNGDVEKSDELSEYGNNAAVADDGTVTGFVRGGRDGFRFTDSITDFSMDGSATVYLNGRELDPGELETVSVITISNDREKAEYEFSVSGNVLEKSTVNDATVDAHDRLSGTTASGHVWGLCDSYWFTGTLTDFQASAPVSVTVDGQEVEPSSDPSHRLVIEGGAEDPTTYRVAVSGDIEKGARAESDEQVDDNLATGLVEGGVDDFRFSGTITRLDVDGNASVTFDEET